MAFKAQSILVLLIIIGVVLAFAGHASAGRDIPSTKDSKNVDKKKPEFLTQEGTVLIPGIGRYFVPKKKCHKFKGVNPFTYNPITGTDGGNGLGNPNLPFVGGTGGVPTYIPGGDDNGIPNPGFEVPTGATLPTPTGASFPTPPARH